MLRSIGEHSRESVVNPGPWQRKKEGCCGKDLQKGEVLSLG